MKTDLSKQFDENGLRLDYSQKLKKLRAYTKFVKNWKKLSQCTEANDLNEGESFRQFIAVAFIWSFSTEGHDFWNDISQK